jgi:hypothetical protein
MAKSNRRAPRTTILATIADSDTAPADEATVLDTAHEIAADAAHELAADTAAEYTDTAPAVTDPHGAAVAFLAAFDPARLPPGMHAKFLSRGNVTRMGRVALAAAGVELDGPTHRAYNELRSGFWSRMGGTLPRREGGTPRAPRTAGGARGGNRAARIAVFAAKIAAASKKLAGILATVPAGAAPLGDGPESLAAVADITAGAFATVAAAVAGRAGTNPAGFEAPRVATPAVAPVPLTAGGFAVLTPAGRRSAVEGGLIDENDAGEKLTILALPDGGKVATVRTASGDRTRIATRFLVGVAV